MNLTFHALKSHTISIVVNIFICDAIIFKRSCVPADSFCLTLNLLLAHDVLHHRYIIEMNLTPSDKMEIIAWDLAGKSKLI